MSQATIASRSINPPNSVDEPGLSGDIGSVYIARIDELRQVHAAESSTDDYGSPALHFIGFFLVVFVFGQIMSQLALLSGHYGAWIVGLLFSLFGVAIALGSLLRGHRHVSHNVESSTNNPTGIRPARANYVAREAPKASA